MYVQIDSSVKYMCVAVSQQNYPLIIRCKDTKKFWNMQVFLKFSSKISKKNAICHELRE